MRSIQAQNERLVKDGVLYDAAAIFQQIFITNGLTERFALVNEIDIALWLLTEQDYRHFYRELHAFVIPANPAQDLACGLVGLDIFLANQVQNETLFRDGEVPLGNRRISIADLRLTADDLLPGKNSPAKLSTVTQTLIDELKQELRHSILQPRTPAI